MDTNKFNSFQIYICEILHTCGIYASAAKTHASTSIHTGKLKYSACLIARKKTARSAPNFARVLIALIQEHVNINEILYIFRHVVIPDNYSNFIRICVNTLLRNRVGRSFKGRLRRKFNKYFLINFHQLHSIAFTSYLLND